MTTGTHHDFVNILNTHGAKHPLKWMAEWDDINHPGVIATVSSRGETFRKSISFAAPPAPESAYIVANLISQYWTTAESMGWIGPQEVVQ
jgi:hypothetical protein